MINNIKKLYFNKLFIKKITPSYYSSYPSSTQYLDV